MSTLGNWRNRRVDSRKWNVEKTKKGNDQLI